MKKVGNMVLPKEHADCNETKIDEMCDKEFKRIIIARHGSIIAVLGGQREENHKLEASLATQ
jgi:hypothetical protein